MLPVVFRKIDVLPAEEPGIDGPGARPDHSQNGAKDRQCDGNPWIAGMREKPRESDRHLAIDASVPATGVHKPTRRTIPAPIPIICRTTVASGGDAGTPRNPK
jgi:hypothetical protein